MKYLEKYLAEIKCSINWESDIICINPSFCNHKMRQKNIHLLELLSVLNEIMHINKDIDR